MSDMVDGSPVLASHAFLCPHCKRVATARVLGRAVWDGYGEQNQHLQPPTQYTFVQCGTCASVAIEWREDFGDGFAADDPGFVYPARRRLHANVPEPLRQEWEGAQTCFESKMYKPCAVMVRSTVEGTCKLSGVEDKTLGQMLRKMRAEGKIDDTLYEWSDMLRVVGNQGAHFSAVQVTREDAQDALMFAEALLDHVYVLRKQFEEFKARQQK